MNFLTTAGPARLRLIFAATAIALAGLLAAAFAGSPASAAYTGRLSWTGKTKPVIVLEHGAWADSSSWDQVIRILTHEGFTVYAPPDPLRGLASDSAYLHDFLTENAALAGKPVVLVGHSYGGAVITDAAVGDREVKALVYVDAFIPAEGESIGALLARPQGAGSCIGGNPAAVFDPVPFPGAPPATSTFTFSRTSSPAASPAASAPARAPCWPPPSGRWPLLPSPRSPARRPGGPSRPGPWSALLTRSSRPRY